MNKKIKYLGLTLCLTLFMGINAPSSFAQSHAEAFNQELNATPIEKMRELGVFLSGSNPDNMPYSFTLDKTWLNFSKKSGIYQAAFEAKAEILKAWEASNLQSEGLKSENVLYPYGQSDILSAITLFPNAQVYILTQESLEKKEVKIEAKGKKENTNPIEVARFSQSVEYNQEFLKLPWLSLNYDKSANYISNYEKNFIQAYSQGFQNSLGVEDLHSSAKIIAQLHLLGAKITNVIFIEQLEFAQVWQTFYSYHKNRDEARAKESSHFITRFDFEINNTKKSAYLITYDKRYTLFEKFAKTVFRDKGFVTLIKYLPDNYWENKEKDGAFKNFMIDKSDAVLTDENGAKFLLSQDKARKWKITVNKNVTQHSALFQQLDMSSVNLKEFNLSNSVFKERIKDKKAINSKNQAKNPDESPILIQRQKHKDFLLSRSK